MSLHEQIVTDDLNVFLDLDDFAEWHDVNGNTCRAVLQETAAGDKLPAAVSPDYDLYTVSAVLHCRAEDLDEIPVAGQALFYIDGKHFTVLSVDVNLGIVTINLQANDR